MAAIAAVASAVSAYQREASRWPRLCRKSAASASPATRPFPSDRFPALFATDYEFDLTASRPRPLFPMPWTRRPRPPAGGIRPADGRGPGLPQRHDPPPGRGLLSGGRPSRDAVAADVHGQGLERTSAPAASVASAPAWFEALPPVPPCARRPRGVPRAWPVRLPRVGPARPEPGGAVSRLSPCPRPPLGSP